MVFAIEEFVRVGKIYFPTLNTSSDEFRNLRDLVDLGVKYDDIVNMMDVFKAWRKDNIIRVCLDMLAIGKLDDLRLMWVARPDMDLERACVSFCRVLLLRKNINLGYSFGSIEAIRVLSALGTSMFEATSTLSTSSVSVCKDMLSIALAGSASEVVQVGARQAVEGDSHYEEGLEQEDHFDVRVVDAFSPC